MSERKGLSQYPMSEKAFVALKAKYELVTVQHKEVHLAIGEAGSDDWHDSAAFDKAIYEASQSRADLARISQLMAGAVVIPMRTETDSVGEFNDVVVLFEDEEEPERYTLTYTSDVKLEIPGTLSVESPFGKNLLGKQKGDLVEYSLYVDGREIQKKAQILEILPGSLGTQE